MSVVSLLFKKFSFLDLHFPQLNDINEVDGTSPTTKAKVEENDDVTSDFDVQEEGGGV